MKRIVLAVVATVALTISLAGAGGVSTVYADHGHNMEGKGHQIKTKGRWAGQLSPGHQKHHTP